MAKFLTKRITRIRSILNKRSKLAGFTLLELLVSMIIGGIITTLLLSLVVQLTEVNQQDSGRSQIQQDMQAALDYIAQDLRESVFVYNGECLEGSANCPGVVNYIPAAMNTATRKPVLAMWKAEPLPLAIAQLCGANAVALAAKRPTDPGYDPNNAMRVNGVPCTSSTTYSLVVYAIETGAVAPWKGRARIVRYRLSQFTSSATAATDQSSGYVNPLSKAEYSFQQWPFDGTTDRRVAEARGGVAPDITQNPAQVLVDFVDDTAGTPRCDEFGTDTTTIENALSPKTGTLNSFYACVRGGGAGSSTGENQDVLVSLAGNTSGLPGFGTQLNNTSRITPIQTRVLLRGVIQKK